MPPRSLSHNSQASSNLGSLPTELIEQIGRHLGQAQDFGRLRLTCRTIESSLFPLFTRKFFTTVILHPVRRRYDALASLSTHPVFCRQVQTIVYPVIPPLRCHDNVVWVERNASGQAWDILLEVLPRLSGLREIQLTASTDTFPELRRDSFAYPSLHAVRLPALSDSLRALFRWITIASEAAVPLRVISIDIATIGQWQEQLGPRPDNFPDHELAILGLSRLESLVIPAPFTAFKGDHFHDPPLCFLIWTTGLKSLDVDFMGVSFMNPQPFDEAHAMLEFLSPRAPIPGQIETMRPAAYLPSLQTLTLRNVYAETDYLVDAIKRLGCRPLAFTLSNPCLKAAESDVPEGVSMETYGFGARWDQVLRALGETSFRRVTLDTPFVQVIRDSEVQNSPYSRYGYCIAVSFGPCQKASFDVDQERVPAGNKTDGAENYQHTTIKDWAMSMVRCRHELRKVEA